MVLSEVKRQETNIFNNDFNVAPNQLPYTRTCDCKPNHINCLSGKDWVKGMVTIKEFYYEKRDIRDKNIHPAVFPLGLPKHFITLLSHPGELILDPFCGVGTTLLAAQDLGRNAVAFDLKSEYIEYSRKRLMQSRLDNNAIQLAIQDDARNISKYFNEGTITLSITSPPYANMLNRSRKNKSIRGDKRNNEHFLKNQQYSNNKRDLGTMNHENYSAALTEVYSGIFPLMKTRGHVVININDVWENNKRFVTHAYVIQAVEAAGFEFRNTFIWDKRPLINNVGIFGYPSNFISLGTTMEFILDFWKP